MNNLKVMVGSLELSGRCSNDLAGQLDLGKMSSYFQRHGLNRFQLL